MGGGMRSQRGVGGESVGGWRGVNVGVGVGESVGGGVEGDCNV